MLRRANTLRGVIAPVEQARHKSEKAHNSADLGTVSKRPTTAH